jgi:hypothetical protein
LKIDSDEDGFIDKSDSFPNDAEFHKKCCIDSSKYVLLEPGEKYCPPNCKCFDITCKCLCIDWNVRLNDKNLKFDENEQVKITIISPFLGLRLNKNDFIHESGCSNIRIEINKDEHLGEWKIYFSNDMPDSPAYIDYDIYRKM